jgi:ABC-type phosphate transport system ATPase subunit
VLALVGPSGCGKTTLLHLAPGLLTVQQGHARSGFLRPAVMFQQPRLLPWKTTRDNIALGLKAAGLARAERSSRADCDGPGGRTRRRWRSASFRTRSPAACRAAPHWRARWCWNRTCC